MSDFIPLQYVRLSIGLIYILAKHIEFKTSIDLEENREEIKILLSGGGDWNGAYRCRVESTQYIVREFDDNEVGCVRMNLRGLSPDGSCDIFTVDLEPPFESCLESALVFRNGELLQGRWRPLVDIDAEGSGFRQLLALGYLVGSVVDNGDIIDIPSAFWRTRDGLHVLNKSERAALLVNGRLVKGDVLVQYERIRDLIRPISTEEYQLNKSDKIPIFLAFALEAARAIGITSDKDMLRQKVERWAQENWHSELGSISEHKVQSLFAMLAFAIDQSAVDDMSPSRLALLGWENSHDPSDGSGDALDPRYPKNKIFSAPNDKSADIRSNIGQLNSVKFSIRGRRQKPYWDDIWVEICRYLIFEGRPRTQAEFISYLQSWCLEKFGEEPGTTTLKRLTSRLWGELGYKEESP